ncbi:MAG: DNA helicase RecQ [Muribaculaceae bacterium]
MANNKLLVSELKKHFGFDTFKGNQEAIIENLIAEHDTFVLMPTGGGKSLCYQLPALMMEGTAIVISPLIALMKNQVDAMRNYSEDDGIAHFLNSSLSREAIVQVKDDVKKGKTKLLYVAPESLTKEENIEFLKTVKISFYAVDEAHCISEWGHDFRPEYRNIRPKIIEIGERPVIALTATATPKVQHDIQKNLGMTNVTVFKSSFNRPNLYYEVRPKTKDVDKEIIRYIKSREGKSGIIYCLSRKKVEELAETLCVNDIKALPYHAGMDSTTRTENQDAFLLEKVDVIVATIAFGMGIDKPDVRFVIHYDIPKSLEGYYQETGRAGRDGGEGECITFYTKSDLKKLEKFMQSKPVNEQEIGKQLLAETAAYAESSVCRRKTLLHYFGETFKGDYCGNCDNCKHPRKRIEARDELCAVIETVLALKEKRKSDYIIKVLLGKPVESSHDEDLEMYGSESSSNAKFLSAVINQGIIEGYLEKGIENYGLIKATQAGKDYIKKPISFKIVEDRDFTDVDIESESRQGGCNALDPELYAMLKDLRKKTAQRVNLPTYVIFQDNSLEAMATTYPITLEELQNIPGVGEGKAHRYGKEFIELIAQHVRENEIDRPVDFRVKTLAKRSVKKLDIIKGIDKQIQLDTLAESLQLKFSDLIDEIESIVYSGTKINIDYYISQIIDDDDVEDLVTYFKECDKDDINAAFQEWGKVFSEDEIRLVRLKFISENGN